MNHLIAILEMIVARRAIQYNLFIKLVSTKRFLNVIKRLSSMSLQTK